VLLLDEPITHLDARLRYEMRFELKLLQRRVGTTTIHVTHDQLEALALADLIVIMRNGVVEQVGTPDDICAHPETTFVAGFVGDPPMSLLRVELGREAGGPWLRLGATRLQPDERLARMLDSVREQHLKIALPADDISLSHPGEAQTILATVQLDGSTGPQIDHKSWWSTDWYVRRSAERSRLCRPNSCIR
jgi:multiple sugar transport system ATP-binding protein